MNPKMLAICALASILSLASSVSADVGRTGRGHNAINPGTFDLGVDGALLYRSTTVPILDGDDAEIGSVNTTQLSLLPSLNARYFPIRNLGVGVAGTYFVDSNSNTTERDGADTVETGSSNSGFLIMGQAKYFLRLGNSFFFAPGVAGGALFGTQETDDPSGAAGAKLERSISGFAGKLDLGFVFYAGQQLNLRAGVELLYRNGTVNPTADEETAGVKGQDFSTIDATVSMGMGYTF